MFSRHIKTQSEDIHHPPKKQSMHLWLFVGLSLTLLGIVGYRFYYPRGNGTHQVALALPPEKKKPLPLKKDQLPNQAKWHHITLHKGATLSHIFHKLDIDEALPQILDDPKSPILNNLDEGQKISLLITAQKKLLKLSYKPFPETKIEVTLNGNDYQFHTITIPLEPHIHYASGLLKNAIYDTGEKDNLSPKLLMELFHIFNWDIDFARSIQPNDRYYLLYEDLYAGDEKIKTGHIEAAILVNKGKAFTAIRFEAPNGQVGYYTPKGTNLYRSFIRTPLNYTRISSSFTRGRYHPILHRIRAHHGTDYAAPYGTPIKATGDGRILFIGRKGGYGRAIIINHGRGYTTLYAHMSRFAKHLRIGTKIKQEQVIGYVGQSGLATGPHLHYEFRINGHYYNPTKVKLPHRRKISNAYAHLFKMRAHSLLAQLNLYRDAAAASQQHQQEKKSISYTLRV